MSETRVPEWFIGGPLHGKDRLIEVPDVQHNVIAAVDYTEAPGRAPEQRTYVRKNFAIGRTTLTIWIVAGMDEFDAGDRLAEILLAPHRAPTPEDGGRDE